jgi:hypothetical protein
MRRVLGVEPRLHGASAARNFFLGRRQLLARRHSQLPLDQIVAGDHLGDRVLDLQPRVHLDEIEFLVLHDEFDRAGADIVGRPCRPDRGRAECAAHILS